MFPHSGGGGFPHSHGSFYHFNSFVFLIRGLLYYIVIHVVFNGPMFVIYFLFISLIVHVMYIGNISVAIVLYMYVLI